MSETIKISQMEVIDAASGEMMFEVSIKKNHVWHTRSVSADQLKDWLDVEFEIGELGTASKKDIEFFLQSANNLSDLDDTEEARLALGLGSGATSNADDFMRKDSNLGDVSNVSQARDNLGLGSAATEDSDDFMRKDSNLSDVASASTARDNLGLGSAATEDSDKFLQVENNLSDLDDTEEARLNLGLGSAATSDADDFMRKDSNLGDVESVPAARDNLGLGSAATRDTDDFATAAQGARADGAIPAIEKGAPTGVATLNAQGKLRAEQVPRLAISEPFVVSSEQEMLALDVQVGDVAIRTDSSETFILQQEPAGDINNWLQVLTPPDGVTSFNGRAGAVESESGDYSADQVSFGSASVKDELERLENEKVDKEAGKGLSANDFTDDDKQKLDGIEEEATKNRADSENADKVHTHAISDVTGLSERLSDIDTLRQDLANPAMGAAMVGFEQDGVGAVERNVEDKLKDWVSVKDFGAVGDGTGNDAPAINAAMALLASRGGGEARLGAGVFRVTDQIVIPNGVTLAGAGRFHTIIKNASTSSSNSAIVNAAFSDSPTNNPTGSVSIKDLAVDGNGEGIYATAPTGRQSKGIHIANARDVNISGCYVYNCYHHGIEVKFSQDVEILNNLVRHCGDDGISVADADSGGMSVTKRVLIHGNTVWDVLVTPFGNTVQVGAGIEVDDGPREVIITNNICYNNRCGIEIHRHSGAGQVHNVIISNNICYANELFQIRATGLGYGTVGSSFIITNNIADARTIQGALGIVLRGCLRTTVSNNTVRGVIASGANDAAISVRDCSYSTIESNNLHEMGGVTNSINIRNSEGIKVANNTIRGSAGNVGIRIDQDSTRTIVFDNDFATNLSDPVLDLGSSTYKRLVVNKNGQTLSYDITGELTVSGEVTCEYDGYEHFLQATVTFEAHGNSEFIERAVVVCSEQGNQLMDYSGDNRHIMGARPHSVSESGCLLRVYRAPDSPAFGEDTKIRVGYIAKGRYMGKMAG